MLGVVTGDNGKIANLLTFEPPAGGLPTLTSLAGAAALQQQMLVLEKRLDELQQSIDYLTDAVHKEVAAEVGAAIDILDDVYDSIACGSSADPNCEPSYRSWT